LVIKRCLAASSFGTNSGSARPPRTNDDWSIPGSTCRLHIPWPVCPKHGTQRREHGPTELWERSHALFQHKLAHDQFHRVLPSPGTSMDHGFQACQRDPVAHQSEHETAQARRSLEALEGKTTLVVRNIPARFTQQEILNHVWVPEGAFDFLFMPHSFKLGQTVGYAFINFTCTSHARAFHRQWHRATLPGGSKGKPLDIHAACFQGLYENLRYLATSDVMRIRNPRFHPCVFNGKHRIDFMAALQSLGLLASGV